MNNETAMEALTEEAFQKQYQKYKKMSEQALPRYLPRTDARSRVLYDAMMYSLSAGGKRLRPVLLLASCEAVGGNPEDALPFACAVEFIHTYSLIHDDHPSIDNDDLRRGKPTNHCVFGDDMAILAGDGLLNSAMDVLLETACACAESRPERCRQLLQAGREISVAAGVRGMAAGQTTDVLMTGGGRPGAFDANAYNQAELLRYIHKNKTGALIRGAVRAGAFIGGAGADVLAALTAYGESVGLVFQIVDDLLDIIGTEEIIGKRVGADAELGKLTYPSVFGMEQSYRFAEQYTTEAVEALQPLGTSGGFLAKLALDLGKRIS